MQCVTLPRITELNPHLICVLCGGYYIDATSIIECLHAFCKSCIVNYLQTHKYCPICDVQVHKTEPLQNIRPDKILQNIVYKLVPNLYKREMRNRRNFYLNVHPQKRPQNTEMIGEITNASNFYAFDDIINLSLEYVDSLNDNPYYLPVTISKRYFRCQAITTVRNLRKMLVAKYSLPNSCELRFFLDGRQLPEHFKLLDLAYISSWNRNGSIRLFYDILIVQRKVIKMEPEPMEVDTTSSPAPTNNEKTPLTECEEPKTISNTKTDEIPSQKENLPITSISDASIQETSIVESIILAKSTINDTCNVSGAITAATIGISSASVSSVSTLTAPIMATGISKSSTFNGATDASIELTAFVSREDEKANNKPTTAEVVPHTFKVKSESNDTRSADIPKLSNGIVTDITNITISEVKSTSALPITIMSTKPDKPARVSREVTISNKNNTAPCTTSALKVQRITPPPIFTRNEPHPVIKTTTCTSKLMSRPWTTTTSAIVSPVISSPASDSKSKLKPKPVMYKTPNSSRFTGNSSIKVKPLYPPYIDIPGDKTVSKTPVLKIDPNTLSPIAAISPSEAKKNPNTSTSNGAKTKSSASTSNATDFSKKIYPYATTKSHSSSNNNYSMDNVASYIHPSLIAGSKHLPGLIPYPPLPCEDTLQPMREFVQRMHWYRSGELDGSNEQRSIDMTKFSALFGHPMYSQPLHPAAAVSNYRPPPSKRPKYEKPSSGATQKPLPPLIRRILPTTTNNVAKVSNNTITNSKANGGRENSKTDKKSDVGFSISRFTPSQKEPKHNAHMCNVEGTNRCDQVGAGENKSNTSNNDKNTKDAVKNQFHINNR